MKKVTEFVIIAPASMGKAAEYAAPRIMDRLSRSFPGYLFHLEPYGPLAREDEFVILPMMGMIGEGIAPLAPGESLMDRYPPKWLLGAMQDVLREFELSPGLH